MEFPTSVKIGPYTYQIERVAHLKGDDGESLYGQITYADGVIRIESDISPARAKAALIHEALHGILEQVGRDSDKHEKLIVTLGTGLLEFIQTNDDAIEYLRQSQ